MGKKIPKKPKEKERKKMENVSTVVNLDELDASLVAEDIELNPDANPMEAPPPVDDGIHRIKLMVDSTSWMQKETKPGKDGDKVPFLSCKIQGVVIAEGTPNNNKRVFDSLNTITFGGKNRMAYILLQALGGKDDPQARATVEGLKNSVALAKEFQRVMAGEPIIRVSTKWIAKHNAGTKDKPEWKTAKSGQKNFQMVDPNDPSKGYLHIINVAGNEVTAVAVPQDYFPDVE